jgi:hypothetical protein
MTALRAALRLALLFAGAVVPLSLTHAQLYTPVARPSAPSHRPMRLFSGKDGKWVWLQQLGNQSFLYLRDRSGPPAQIASGREWVEVVLDGDTVWILERRRSRSAILKLAASPGNTPSIVFDGLSDPGGLHVANGRVHWFERIQTNPEAPTWVPAAGPILRLTVGEAAGKTRVVGEWPGGTGSSGQPGAGDIIGELEGAVWTRIRRMSSTELVRFPVDRRAPELVASIEGVQSAKLAESAVLCTAPSTEAAVNGLLSVRRYSSSGLALITDWLPGGGDLVPAGGDVFYSGAHLYRLPTRLAAPEPLRVLRAGRVDSDGSNLVLLTETGEPSQLDWR